MLKRLTIRNFQRHRKLELKLDKYVTTIVGRTDAGKSSILRALRWLCLNRPNGKAIIRRGAKNASVTCVVDGITLRRGIGAANTYRMETNVYRAFRGGVPEAIERLLKVDEINFQRQHESHFWFGLTPGATAKELNKLVDLDTIDRVQQELAAQLREAKSELELVSRQRIESAALAKRFGWTAGAMADIGRLSRLFAQYGTKSHQMTQIRKLAGDGSQMASRYRDALAGLSGAVVPHQTGVRLFRLSRQLAALGAVCGAVRRAGAGLWSNLPAIDRLADSRDQLARFGMVLDRADEMALHCAECNGNLKVKKDELEKKLEGRCPYCGGILTERSSI